MFTDIQRQQLIAGAAEWGLTVDSETVERFALYAEQIEVTNRTLNLTRVPPEEIVPRHFLDSLSLATFLQPKPGWSTLDVGTGAGFPGIPIALSYPALTVTLLDGTRKRLAFLDEVLSSLHLANARTLHARAEEIQSNSPHFEQYDLVLARAVAPLPVLITWMMPFVRRNGLAIAYKTLTVEEEIWQSQYQLNKTGAVIEKVQTVTIPYSDVQRKLVVLRKSRRSP